MIKTHYSAFSLLELLLVLTVAGALLFAGTNFYLNTRNQARVSEATEKIDIILHASYQWLGSSRGKDFCGSGSCLTTQNLIDAGLLNNAQLAGPWPARWQSQNSIQINVMTARPTSLYITVPNVPTVYCNNLRNKMLNKANGTICKSTTHEFVACFSSDANAAACIF